MDGMLAWLQNVTRPPHLYALLGAAALLMLGVGLLIRGGGRQAKSAPPAKDEQPPAMPAVPPAAPLQPDGTVVVAHLMGKCGDDDIKQTLRITADTLLGRDPDCALCLTSLRISRRHLRLVACGGQLWAENLSRSTITCVEGELLLAPRALRSGDELLLGETRLTITFGEEHA